jgi:hypothetical protein
VEPNNESSTDGSLIQFGMNFCLKTSSKFATTMSTPETKNSDNTLVNDADNKWQITITDTTTGDSYQNVVTYNTSRLSAEWIVERPKINEAFSALSNFGNVTFTNCTTTISSATGTINNFDFIKAVMYPTTTPLNDSDRLADVSNLSAEGSTFTVSYLTNNALP